jgi:hypothetical protein
MKEFPPQEPIDRNICTDLFADFFGQMALDISSYRRYLGVVVNVHPAEDKTYPGDEQQGIAPVRLVSGK